MEEKIDATIQNSGEQGQSTKAVPFITFDTETKKFVISPQARKIIAKPEYKKVGMISLVGKYRTGKSFLLNRVLINGKRDTTGFDVGPTIKPCTKGIWLWSNPLIISNTHSKEPFPAFLIDTEGLGAYDEEVNHDSKIFLIAILISSLFIYNSFGTIDETAINSLSLILNLSKSIRLHNGKNNDEEEMAKYFPSLLWLLRDFALKLEDSDGNVITAKQYLENALMLQKGSTDTIEEKNNVRKLIKTYFPERDCFPMVRPVENEADLQNLQSLPDENIRSEFLSQAEILRNKVLKKTKPKNFNGKLLSGSMLLELVESVISSINEGVIPVIENSWKYVISNECMKSINEIIAEYKSTITKYQSENISRSDYFSALEKYNSELINALVKKFIDHNSIRFDDIKEYTAKLKTSLNQEFKKLNEDNVVLIKEKYSNDLQKELNDILGNENLILNQNYSSFISEIIQIKEKIDSITPSFTLKSQICFDKVINTIKKYIEESFIKAKKESEKKMQMMASEKELLSSKYNNVVSEYEKDKKEFKDTINQLNESLIEYKLREKSYEEKIKNFENEKKTLKETNEMSIKTLNKENESKIENYLMQINRLKNDLKTKEEELLLGKLNNDKVNALKDQKLTFLEKEIEQWKERFTEQGKELTEVKNELASSLAENEKLKDEKKNMEYKLHYEKNNNNLNSSMNSINFAALREDNKISPEVNEVCGLITANYKEVLEFFNGMNKTMSTLASFNVNLNKINSSLETMQKNISTHQNLSSNISNNSTMLGGQSNGESEKSTPKAEEKEKIVVNKTFAKPQVNIVNTLLNKDEAGKPFLEYQCEVNYNGNIWKLNKKFNQFALLNKTLKNLFKGLITLPDSGALFSNINDTSGNMFHENKINQLDKYIKELCKSDAVIQSIPFRGFFELDENHQSTSTSTITSANVSVQKMTLGAGSKKIKSGTLSQSSNPPANATPNSNLKNLRNLSASKIKKKNTSSSGATENINTEEDRKEEEEVVVKSTVPATLPKKKLIDKKPLPKSRITLVKTEKNN